MENAEEIIRLVREMTEGGAKAAVFPELSVTGYSLGELVFQKTLLSNAEAAVVKIARETADCEIIFTVGVPVAVGCSIYNCAAVIYKGVLLGLVAKTHLPNYGEFYEARYFASSPKENIEVSYANQRVLLGNKLIFKCRSMPDFAIGVEICEDLYVPIPRSSILAPAGASIIFNLSASNELVGKDIFRISVIKALSARLYCGYVYAGAGQGESTSDLVFAGQCVAAENGYILSEQKWKPSEIMYSDIDVERIASERRRCSTYAHEDSGVTAVYFDMGVSETALGRKFPRFPFIPLSNDALRDVCEEILTIQSKALQSRLSSINCKYATIGLSGGLDSTLALLVTVRAFDALGLDRKNISAITMPGMGTTQKTKSNAEILANSLKVGFSEISIERSVLLHLDDIGQPEGLQDVVFENSQARERTQILMDVANKTGGIVIGTGDLSELALGWCTYNGDHMSMYGVNCGVPKTLVKYLVEYVAVNSEGEIAKTLFDILDTPISPELIAPKDGEIIQKTEEIIGPYELHDFFLYYIMRFGFSPSKVYRMAREAFGSSYSGSEIMKWLTMFYRRFFSQQFKRNAIPDGVKVGTVALSPRGDWRMPSDAVMLEWVKETEELSEEE
jgi:NAD+ synthase (glutamine-hydrolysing)